MPLQPNIALQVQGLQLPDPLAQSGRVAQIQNALQEQRIGEMKIQNAMREQRRKGELEKILGGFGPEAKAADISPALVRGGFLTEARTLMQSEAQLEETRRKAQEAEYKGMISKADLVGRVLGAARDQDSFDFAIKKLSEQGIFTPADVQFLGSTYDPTRVKRILDTTMSQKDRLEAAIKERATAATESQAATASAKLPFERQRAEAAMISARAAEARAGQEQVPASIREFRAAQAMPKAERTAFEAFQAAKRPTTTINMQQESALRKELGETQGKIVSDGYKAAEDAISTMDTINIGRDLLNKGVVTGFGADFLVNTGQALKQVGIDLNSDAAANAQTYAATLAGNVGRLIKLFGAGTGLSNADREYAEKMAGGKISLDERALRRILDINERSARNVITKHNANVDRFKAGDEFKIEMPPERTSTLPPRDQQALDWARSNPTDPRSAQILKRLGME
jgi:hypothetical protein